MVKDITIHITILTKELTTVKLLTKILTTNHFTTL